MWDKSWSRKNFLGDCSNNPGRVLGPEAAGRLPGGWCGAERKLYSKVKGDRVCGWTGWPRKRRGEIPVDASARGLNY